MMIRFTLQFTTWLMDYINIAKHATSNSSRTVSQSVRQSACQLDRHPVSQAVHQSIGPLVSQSVSVTVHQSVRQAVHQSVVVSVG